MVQRAGTRAKAQGKKRKSRVNEAGNYTKPGMRKRMLNQSKQAAKVVSRDGGQLGKLRC